MGKLSKRSTATGTIVIVLLTIIGAGGFFGYKFYQKAQEDKIYSTGEIVSFPDFDFKVTKAEFKAVDLPIDQKTIAEYGPIDKMEECEKMSKERTVDFFLLADRPVFAGPSDFQVCIRRNDSRKEINEYSANNKQLVADYEIFAKNNITTADLKITLVADSGRKLNARVDAFNRTQLFKGTAQKRINLEGFMVYTPESTPAYIPYHQSDIGGDIHKGLARTGYAYTDIRNSERSVDIKVTYSQGSVEHTRIVRVNR